MTPADKDLWLLPLGGCGEIGINMNLYGHAGRWLMVDCGVGFERNGANTRIIAPSPAFIADRREFLDGLLVTHAHEDHVGAIAHLWPQLQCPVFCTAFTAQILQRKLAEAGLAGRVPVTVVRSGSRQQLGAFSIEWVDLTHSTPESQALMIRTAAGNVFHTGDWKLDPAPQVGAHYSQERLQALGDEGITAMVCDSTNAQETGHSASEGALYPHLLKQVQEAPARVLVACFGSNVGRLHTLMQVAVTTGRYPGLLGRSLENYYRAAKAAGLWTLDSDYIPAGHLGYLPREEVMAVATGSQGEVGAALHRLARGDHPAMELEPDDTIIFSARVIPGNEDSLAALEQRLRDRGCRVIKDDNPQAPIHATGHPAQDELRAMYSWIKPRIAVPVHGEEAHLKAHAQLAKQAGVPMQLQGLNGDLFRLAPQPGMRRGIAPVGRIIIER